MSWRTVAAVVIAVFSLTIIWVTLGDPLIQIANSFKDIGTSGQFNYDSKIDGLVGTWFNTILVAVFGLMAWGAWRLLRRELTRGGI
jgi:TRAP-type C4-dicarboxylate transport system permease small subunit